MGGPGFQRFAVDEIEPVANVSAVAIKQICQIASSLIEEKKPHMCVAVRAGHTLTVGFSRAQREEGISLTTGNGFTNLIQQLGCLRGTIQVTDALSGTLLRPVTIDPFVFQLLEEP